MMQMIVVILAMGFGLSAAADPSTQSTRRRPRQERLAPRLRRRQAQA